MSSYPPLLIVGSQNVQEEDRFLSRSEIYPVQVLYKGEIKPIQWFNDLGEFGVSSFAWNPSAPLIFFFSTGDDFIRINLEDKSSKKYDIENLGGIHEMDFIDGSIYISNTRFDEIIVFDPIKEILTDRIQLAELTPDDIHSRKKKSSNQVVDKYHCNQLFQGFDDDIYFLAHHVTGRQFLKKIAGALLKSQGNGGVFNLDKNKAFNLSLKAPHSVVKVLQKEYWVFNSAYSTIQIHDKNWELVDELNMKGFGRGACLSPDDSLFFGGISPPRKRYLKMFDEHEREKIAGIEVFSTRKRRSLEMIQVQNIEQVNNIYVLSENQVKHLYKLADEHFV